MTLALRPEHLARYNDLQKNKRRRNKYSGPSLSELIYDRPITEYWGPQPSEYEPLGTQHWNGETIK